MFICVYSKSFQYWIWEPLRSWLYMESWNRMCIITYDRKYHLTYLLKSKTHTNMYRVRAELERKAEELGVKVTAQTMSKLSPHGYTKASSLVTWYGLVCPKPLRHTSVSRLDQATQMLFLLASCEVFQKCKGNKLAQCITIFPFTPHSYYTPSYINMKICLFFCWLERTQGCTVASNSAHLLIFVWFTWVLVNWIDLISFSQLMSIGHKIHRQPHRASLCLFHGILCRAV